MTLFAVYGVAAVLVCAFIYGIRWAKPVVGLVLCAGLAAFMTAYWGVYGNELGLKWFSLTKFFSVFVAFIFLQVFRIVKWRQNFGIVVYLILAVNILEAVVSDFQRLSIFGAMNGLAGCLLIACQPLPNNVLMAGEKRDLIFPTTMLWVIAYSVWNYAFVYGFGMQNINSGFFGFLHLGTPLLFCLLFKNSTLYLQFRTWALSLSMFFWVFPPTRSLLEPGFSIFIPQVWQGLCAVSLILALVLLWKTYGNQLSSKRNK